MRTKYSFGWVGGSGKVDMGIGGNLSTGEVATSVRISNNRQKYLVYSTLPIRRKISMKIMMLYSYVKVGMT